MSLVVFPQSVRRARVVFSLLVSLLTQTLSLHAEDLTWLMPPLSGPYATAQSWDNTNFWSPPQVPTGQDSVTIPGGSVQLVSMSAAKVMTVNGAEVQGPGPLNIQDLRVYGSCSFLDASAINFTNYPTGQFRYELWDYATFLGRIQCNVKWENFGEATITNSTFLGRQTAYSPPEDYQRYWRNNGGSEMVLFGSNYFIYFTYPPNVRHTLLHEFGAKLRHLGTNRSRIEWDLYSHGEIEVAGGQLQFTDPALLNGPVTIAAGATLRLESVNHDLTIDADATFSGDGNLEFYGGNAANYFNASAVIECPARITNSVFRGEPVIFTRPVIWRGSSWQNPVTFFLGGRGAGGISNSMMNMGPMLDSGIASAVSAVAYNLAPGYYNVSNGTPTGLNYQGTNQNMVGWFTNGPGATVHFLSGTPESVLRWNLHNSGTVRFDSGVKVRLPGSFVQGPFGRTELSGQTIAVRAHTIFDGYISGWGGITSHNAQVSCTLSPHGSNSAFGRIALYTANDFFTAFPTNLWVMSSNTVFELDLGAPGTTNDFIQLSGPNLAPAATLNIRAQDGFGPGTYTVCNTARGKFRFGTVPSGYRFTLATNANNSALQVIVSQPSVPTATFRMGGGNGGELILNTVTNTSYRVDQTESLNLPWQYWTNVTGDGGNIVLPVDPSVPARFFRVIENP